MAGTGARSWDLAVGKAALLFVVWGNILGQKQEELSQLKILVVARSIHAGEDKHLDVISAFLNTW